MRSEAIRAPRRVGLPQVFEVGFLPGPPGRLAASGVARRGVGAGPHDSQHFRAEAPGDLGGVDLRGMVLEGIVEQSGYGLVLASAVRQGEGAHPEEVRYIGDLCALAGVGPV